MKKTVLIIYSQLYDASALALIDFFESDRRYDVVAVPDNKYDNFRLIRTYHGLYKFTYRYAPVLNNIVINLPTAEVTRSKDNEGNTVAYKPNSQTFQRWRKFDNISMRFDADYVICTTQYSIHKAVIAREKYKLGGKIFALITDYDLQNNFVSHDVDGYFVITQKCKTALIDKGIDESIIYVVSMPLKTPTAIKRSKEDVRKQFNIRNELPIITMVGGRYGSKYLCDALTSVCENKEYNFIVIDGGNSSIEKKFKKLGKKEGLSVSNNVYFVKSGNEMERAYYISDCIISAPTSAITYEVLLHKIPLLLIDSANNVETKNSKFLVANGYAYSAINKERLTIALEKYIKEKKEWKKHCENKFKLNGCQQVLDCINAIDRGDDPQECLIVREIAEDTVKDMDDMPAPTQDKALDDTKNPKKKRRWFGGK
ncbi:MAG: hypothetical protein K2O35_01735 [Clostridia bacterium]|nr:hypothetical protein [Clostridia bacterium]